MATARWARRSTRRSPPPAAARYVIAEINEQMPRTHGNTLVPFSRIDAFTRTDRPLAVLPPSMPSAVDDAIGEHIAALVPDRATLQMGIGAIPDAALRRLFDKHDLGVHTEMFSDGIVDLVEAGVVTNRFKRVHPGRIATSFVMGTRRVYDFVNDNPFVEFYPCDHTNDTAVIRRNDQVVAINAALEIDLSGQVVADSIGFRIYSGIGGQMDFIRGAALSSGRDADHRPAVDRGRRPAVPHRADDQPGRRRRHHQRSRALGRHGVWRGRPVRQDAPRAGGAARRHRASRLPG